MSGRYGSVKCQHGSSGIMTRRVMCTWTCGCIKADDDDAQVQMSGHMSSVGQVIDMGGGLSGHGKHVEMGESGCV